MTKNIPISYSFILEILLVLLIWGGAIAIEAGIVQSLDFQIHPQVLAFAITFDLVVLLPFVYYLWGVRYHKFNLISVFPVIIISLISTYYILPPQHHFFLHQFEYLLIFLEIAFLGYGLAQLRKVVYKFKQLELIQTNFSYNLQQSMTEVWGKNIFTQILSSEFVMLYFALAGWRMNLKVKPNQLIFSSYRECGYLAIAITVLVLMFIEGLIVHILLAYFNFGLVAWVVSAISLYGALFVVADLFALLKNPIILTNNQLFMRIGLRWYAEIDLQNIADIQIINDLKPSDKPYLQCTTFGFPNVLITLKQAIKVNGIYGINFTASKIALNIDQAGSFNTQVLSNIELSKNIQ
jgi:hypothetical protein